MVATSPITTVTLARRCGGNRMKLVANTVGIMAPPRNPWSSRKTIIESRFQAKAQAKLIAVNPTAEITNRMRVDKRRER